VEVEWIFCVRGIEPLNITEAKCQNGSSIDASRTCTYS